MRILSHFFSAPKPAMESPGVMEPVEIKPQAEDAEVKDISKQLEALGVDPKSELGQAMALAAQKGVPVEAATLDDMKEFIENVNGTTEEKLETVAKAIDKGIGVSSKAMTMLHAALHEPMLPEAVRDQLLQMLQAQTPKSEVRQMLLETAQNLPSLETVSPQALVEAIALLNNVLQQSGADLQGLTETQLSALVKAFVEAGQEPVDLEALLADAIEKGATDAALLPVIQQDGLALEMPEAPLENPRPMDEGFADERLLDDIQRFLENLDDRVEALVEHVKETVDTGSPLIQAEGESRFEGDEKLGELDESQGALLETADEILALLQDQSNTFLVREVTEKMAELTNEFRDFKQQVVNTLTDVAKAIEQPQRMPRPEQAEQLGKVIDQVDKVLLKSDMTLYTDMKSEKQFMQFSTDLAEARTLLQSGDQEGAKEIIDQVIKELDAMVFKPTKMKVMHVVNQTALEQAVQLKNMTATETMAKFMTDFEEAPKTGRTVLDYMRQLGLNEDSEVLQRLGVSKNEGKQEQKIENDMRQILQKLSEEFEDRTKVVQAGEKMMNHLTGQQLGNKLEAKAQTQSLFFNIPIAMQDEIKDLKLYVNSRKQNQKMDWENASMYFAIQTKHYDEMGIRVTAVNRGVTITVLNDHDALKTALEPMMDAFKAEIEEVGYKVGSVNYSRLTAVKEPDTMKAHADEPKPQQPMDHTSSDAAGSKKGFDVRI